MFGYTRRSEMTFGKGNPDGGGASIKKERELVGLKRKEKKME
jgi:hypothetical protein